MSHRIWPLPKGERPHVFVHWLHFTQREEAEMDPEPLTGNKVLIEKFLSRLGEAGGCEWFNARFAGPSIPVFTQDDEETFCVTDGTDDPQDEAAPNAFPV